MVAQTWLDVIQQSFYGLLYGIIGYLPALLFAIIVFIVGWVIGVWLGWVVEQVVRAVKVDQALKSAGVDDIVARGGFRLDSGAFLGALVRWFVILVGLITSLEILGLTAVTAFLQEIVVYYLPHIVMAVLIILAAAVLAQAAQNIVVGAARAAGITSAGFAGTVARWAIWAFAILAALDQLGVTPLIQILFQGVVIALALAFGLAFGLGGQDSASRFLDKTREQMSK